MKYIYPEKLYKKIYSDDFSIYGIYFKAIINSIYHILNSINSKSVILDFGCGDGYLKKIYYKNQTLHKIINYDVIEDKSEIKDYKGLKYDVIVASHVFCLFSEEKLNNFIKEEINKNENIKFIVAVGRQGFISKLAQFLTNKKDVNNYNQISGKKEFEILSKYRKLVLKKNIFFMTDVCFFI